MAGFRNIIEKDDRMLFARWLRNPLKIGAVVPSGVALARAVAAEIDISRPGAVVELGGGTGSVTRALLAAGIPPADLVVVERDATLYRLLHERFPGVHVIHGDATRLPRLLARAGIGPVKAVVSGLPLLAMPPKVQLAILLGSFQAMLEDGAFIQFTYGPKSPVPERLARRLGLTGRIVGRIWLNMPPAAIWRFVASARVPAEPRRIEGGTRQAEIEPAAAL